MYFVKPLLINYANRFVVFLILCEKAQLINVITFLCFFKNEIENRRVGVIKRFSEIKTISEQLNVLSFISQSNKFKLCFCVRTSSGGLS